MKVRMTITISILLIPAILICACPVDVAGHDATNGSDHSHYTAPRVGKTRVVSTTFLPAPFINTEATIALGYGKSSNVVTPLLEIEGQPVLGLEGDLIYAILGFEYSHAVRDWVAVWAQMRITARLGNELQSLLAQGVSTATGFELGWLIRLYENDRHILSTGISVRSGSVTLVDILGWTNGVIEDENVSLVRKSPTLGTLWDLRYVYAANDFTALQALGQLAYSETVDRATGNEWYYGFGGLVSLDLTGKAGTPIGLALGYKYTTVPEGGNEIADHVHAFLVGLSYVGRPDFSIGIDLQFQRVPIKGIDDPAKFFTAMITMDYFF